MPRDFAHLHLHSVYSVLDGSNKVEEFVKYVKELGMTSVALTDHGVMSGAIDFYKECTSQGVKPLVGVEAYITDDEDDIPKETRHRDNHHLVMVAQNETGYQNLLHLVSNAAIRNFYYKPRISKTTLAKYSSGIIATSACLGNECNHKACFEPVGRSYSDPEDRARKAAYFYKEVFQGRYFLEIQDNDDEAGQQAAYNKFVIDLAKRDNHPLVITSDAHYMKKDDKAVHDILMALQTKQTLAQYQSPENTFKYGPWFYIRSGDEMWTAANKYGAPEAFENTLVIRDQCNLKLDIDKIKPPVFDMSSITDRDEFEVWLNSRHTEESSEHDCQH